VRYPPSSTPERLASRKGGDAFLTCAGEIELVQTKTVPDLAAKDLSQSHSAR
jgi:hypothetical protein